MCIRDRSIINNSDCKILLDQRKYMNKFDQIQALLGLTEKEKSQILSINMANNPSRPVSYTHLDVYKRQVRKPSIALPMSTVPEPSL